MPDPIAVGIDVIGVPWLAVLIKVGALTCLTSFILVFLYGQSRIFFTMAKDGLLPQVFQTVHPRFRTPHLGQVILGLVVGIVSGWSRLRSSRMDRKSDLHESMPDVPAGRG